MICINNLNKIHENLAFEKSISGCCSMNLAKRSKYEITILFVIHKERGGLHHQLSKFTALVEKQYFNEWQGGLQTPQGLYKIGLLT